jgi:hypothetical protein
MVRPSRPDGRGGLECAWRNLLGLHKWREFPRRPRRYIQFESPAVDLSYNWTDRNAAPCWIWNSNGRRSSGAIRWPNLIIAIYLTFRVAGSASILMSARNVRRPVWPWRVWPAKCCFASARHSTGGERRARGRPGVNREFPHRRHHGLRRLVQLRRFGAGIFIADLVGIAIVREMATHS